MIPRLKELYNKEIKLSLKDKYNFKNLNMAPEVEKIVINMGLGIDGNDAKIVKACEEDLSKITGQKPFIATEADKISSVALITSCPCSGISMLSIFACLSWFEYGNPNPVYWLEQPEAKIPAKIKI